MRSPRAGSRCKPGRYAADTQTWKQARAAPALLTCAAAANNPPCAGSQPVRRHPDPHLLCAALHCVAFAGLLPPGAVRSSSSAPTAGGATEEPAPASPASTISRLTSVESTASPVREVPATGDLPPAAPPAGALDAAAAPPGHAAGESVKRQVSLGWEDSPQEFLCPISHEPMFDPVTIAQTGQT